MKKNKRKFFAALLVLMIVLEGYFGQSAKATEKKINLNCIKGFSYFFTGDFKCHSMHTEGKMAIGGMLISTNNLSICTNENVDEPTLVIGKGANVKALQTKYGYCTVEENCTGELHFEQFDIQSHHDYKEPIRQNVFNFNQVDKILKQYSNELDALPDNCTVEKKDGRMILKTDKTEGQAVFSITAEDIKDVSQQIDIDINPEVTVLINVKGETVDIPNCGGIRILNTYNIEKGEAGITQYYGNILWNFNEADEINLGLSFKGTILAPNADINITSSGNIEGQLIAKNFTQPSDITWAAYESHLNMFNRNIVINKDDPEEPEMQIRNIVEIDDPEEESKGPEIDDPEEQQENKDIIEEIKDPREEKSEIEVDAKKEQNTEEEVINGKHYVKSTNIECKNIKTGDNMILITLVMLVLSGIILISCVSLKIEKIKRHI